jgi:hypothetical protein
MAASAEDLATARRLAAEPTEGTYDDEALSAIVEGYPIPDVDGNDPTDDAWAATYDLFLAASQIWTEKAAALLNAGGTFDFSADDASFKRSQLYDQYKQMADTMRVNSRRLGQGRGARSVTQKAAGPFRATDQLWIGNLPEQDPL